MEIQIKKCSKDTYWYNDKIGKIFTVTDAIKYPFNAGKGFEVYQEGQRKFIDIDDAEIVFNEF
jgi:hypothetical protein